MKLMKDSAVYIIVAKVGLLETYYLISWKSYLENESTLKPTLPVMYF